MAASSVADIPGDWIYAAGRSFKYFKDPKSFADASAICRSLGGFLAFDDHPEVNALLSKSGILTSTIFQSTDLAELYT